VSLVTAAVAETLPHRTPPSAGISGYVPSPAAQLVLFHRRLSKFSEFLARAGFLCDDVTLQRNTHTHTHTHTQTHTHTHTHTTHTHT